MRLTFVWVLGATLAVVALFGCHREPRDSTQTASQPPRDPGPSAAESKTKAPVTDSVSQAMEASGSDSSGAGGAGGSPATLAKIYLQELGEPLPEEDLAFILRSLSYFFPNPVVTLPSRPLPESAYYSPRKRYRAEKVLDTLVALTPDDAQVMVALTTVDISTTKGPYEDWGILGLATIAGRECVISRFRAAREAKSPEHIRERLAKVVVHEIGHTLGLSHCPTYSCLMEDGKGSVLTTDHELDFCAACREAVGPKLLSRDASLPWSTSESTGR